MMPGRFDAVSSICSATDSSPGTQAFVVASSLAPIFDALRCIVAYSRRPEFVRVHRCVSSHTAAVSGWPSRDPADADTTSRRPGRPRNTVRVTPRSMLADSINGDSASMACTAP